MRKFTTYAVAVLCMITVVAALLLTSACSKEDEFPSWNLTADGSVTARFSDNGKHGFILTVEGNGAIPDYASAKEAPWYYRSGRVTTIAIEEGITAVGDNAFAECAVGSVVLPGSMVSVGEKSFPQDAQVCAYSQVNAKDGRKVFLYSETKPQTDGEYWRFKNGVAVVWETIRVLFIGNSFTYYSDIPSLFEQIAEGAGEMVEAESVTNGSWTLTKFADETDEYGKQVSDKLNATDEYDAVVLQEQSTRPLTNYSAFESAVRALKAKIKGTQKNCEIYLYSTWGYAEAAETRKETIPELEAEIRKAYEKAAGELNLQVCQVGKAFSTVYTEYPDINLYFDDNKHPSYVGAYLSACVHAATILGCDVRETTFDGTLESDTAALLRGVAYETVFGA